MDTRGFYFNDLQPYLKLFSKDQIFFIDGHSIVKNPTAEFGLIEDFLDVDRELKFSYNEIRGFYCLEKPSEMCLGGNKGRTRYSSYIICYIQATLCRIWKFLNSHACGVRYCQQWRLVFVKILSFNYIIIYTVFGSKRPTASMGVKPQAPVAQKISDQAVFRRFQGEGVGFF